MSCILEPKWTLQAWTSQASIKEGFKDLNEQKNSLPAPVLYRRRRGRHAAMTVSTTPRKVPWHVFASAASHHQRPRLVYLGLLGLHPGDKSASGTPWSPDPDPGPGVETTAAARRGRKGRRKTWPASLMRVTCIRIERSTMERFFFVWWSRPSVIFVFDVVIQVQLDRQTASRPLLATRSSPLIFLIFVRLALCCVRVCFRGGHMT